MVQIDCFEVRLAGDIFYSGSMINGTVKLVLSEAMKAREVRLQVEGCASTRWTEHRTTRSGNQTHHHTDVYTATEMYISLRLPLWPAPQNPGTEQLLPGSYDFPFTFQLPYNCPSSLEAQFGNIRYNCKAVIDRPWHFDSKFKLPFSVVSLVDLNQTSSAIVPFQKTESKNLSCLSCATGQIQCQIDLPRQGYVPGESIPLNLIIENASQSRVTYTKVKLVENIEFTAKHGWNEHCKSSSRAVVELQGSQIESGESQDWRGKLLAIPPVAPTLDTCSIIKLSYQLQINAHNDACCTRALKTFAPILIGNIPLVSIYTNVLPTAPILAPADVTPSAPLLPAYPDLPPPSYEEATFGAGEVRDENDDENTTGPTSYAPKYPFYRWLSKPAED